MTTSYVGPTGSPPRGTVDPLTQRLDGYKGRWGQMIQAAKGGGKKVAPTSPGWNPDAPVPAMKDINPLDMDQQVSVFQNYIKGSTGAIADRFGRDFNRNVGNLLTDLNGIGALRSGGVQAGLNEASDYYGRSVGEAASSAALSGVGMAQQEKDLSHERRYRKQSDRKAGRAANWGAVGNLGGRLLSLGL